MYGENGIEDFGGYSEGFGVFGNDDCGFDEVIFRVVVCIEDKNRFI